MKFTSICAPLLLATALLTTACKSSGGGSGPDWDAWRTELRLAGETIARALEAFPDKTGMLLELESARKDALVAVEALAGGEGSSEGLKYLEAAAEIAASLTDDEDVRLAAFALGEVVARIQYYLLPEVEQ